MASMNAASKEREVRAACSSVCCGTVTRDCHKGCCGAQAWLNLFEPPKRLLDSCWALCEAGCGQASSSTRTIASPTSHPAENNKYLGPGCTLIYESYQPLHGIKTYKRLSELGV